MVQCVSETLPSGTICATYYGTWGLDLVMGKTIAPDMDVDMHLAMAVVVLVPKHLTTEGISLDARSLSYIMHLK